MTASLNLKRAAVTGLFAIVGTAGAVGVSAATAPEASAKVPSGSYTMVNDNFGIKTPNKAWVKGNRLVMPSPFGNQSFPLHQTPHGAYADVGMTRYTFRKTGNGHFSGQVHLGPIVIGGTSLHKR